MRFRTTRRGLIAKLTRLCLALLLMVIPLVQRAKASDPQEVVRSFYGVLLNNMRDGRMFGESGRLARLVPVVDRTFDVPAMTRLAVAPRGRTSTPPNSSS
jgi:phospholipid transport system substrate-binding protein